MNSKYNLLDHVPKIGNVSTMRNPSLHQDWHLKVWELKVEGEVGHREEEDGLDEDGDQVVDPSPLKHDHHAGLEEKCPTTNFFA